MEQKLHPFEAAGLGEAPFYLDHVRWGVYYQACAGAPFQPGGSCDYCGTAIVNQFWIVGSNPAQKPFKVGCDCVEKVFKQDAPIVRAVRDAKSVHERAKRSEKRAVKAQAKREKIAAERAERVAAALAKIEAEHPGFSEAIQNEHHIVQSIAGQLVWGLSAKQIEVVLKIHADSKRPPEVKVPAPVGGGRKRITGVVLSKKRSESQWGVTIRMTIKCEGEGGVWLANGTVLKCGEDERGFEIYPGIGDTVSFDATLEASDEPHFAFFKRPTKGKLQKSAERIAQEQKEAAE
jgi:hypothetical protein